MIQTIKSLDIHGTEYEVPVSQLKWRPAAYAIIIKDGKILLTKQHNAFHLPGGGMELGEMPEESVIREVQEETGLIVDDPRLIHSLSGFFSYTMHDNDEIFHVHSLLHYYMCNVVGGELSIDGFEEDEKLVGEMPEWIPLEQLDDIVAGSTVDWRRVVKTALI